MLKVNHKIEVNHQLNVMDKGTLMHEVLENLYKPYISLILKTESYDKMLKNLPNALEKLFTEKIKNGKKRTGKNALVFKVIEEVIKRFLIAEKQQVSTGNEIQIISLEYKFSRSIYVKALDKKINFKGTIDRIDILNDTLRIIDYKKGI